MSKSVIIDHDVLEVINNFKRTAISKGIIVEVIDKALAKELKDRPRSSEKILEDTY
jgi:hypothetical protein